MPKCVVCMKAYHPDWMVVDEVRGEEVKKCNFCFLDKNELTLTDENGKIKYKVTKEQAHKNYLQFLENQSRKPEVQQIFAKAIGRQAGKK